MNRVRVCRGSVSPLNLIIKPSPNTAYICIFMHTNIFLQSVYTVAAHPKPSPSPPTTTIIENKEKTRP